MRTTGIPGRAADAQHFPMRHERAARRRTGLHRDRAHVSVIRIVAIGMMQADINAEIDLVILWIPPAGIDDLVRICRSIHRPV